MYTTYECDSLVTKKQDREAGVTKYKVTKLQHVKCSILLYYHSQASHFFHCLYSLISHFAHSHTSHFHSPHPPKQHFLAFNSLFFKTELI